MEMKSFLTQLYVRYIGKLVSSCTSSVDLTLSPSFDNWVGHAFGPTGAVVSARESVLHNRLKGFTDLQSSSDYFNVSERLPELL